MFDYASNHNFFEGSNGLDYELLRTIQNLTKHLEVKICTPREWEMAVLLGFDIWRKLNEKRQGRVVCNMNGKSMIFEDY